MRIKHFGFRTEHFRKTISMGLSLLMMLSVLPLHALAASYDVSTADEMASSWDSANQNSDSQNTFNMTASIDMSGHTLTTVGDKDYVVNGKGNTLSNVTIIDNPDPTDPQWERPTVTINANVTDGKSPADEALLVSGNVSVAVKGDATASTYSSTVIASDAASVSVSGDVVNTGSGSAVTSASSTVKIGGNAESKGGIAPTVNATNGTVIVEGDVIQDVPQTCSVDAVAAVDANVTIKGDLKTGGDAALLRDNSKLTVYGDVEAGSSALTVYDSKVEVRGNVTSNGQSLITDNSQVTIKGDFTVQPATGVTTDGGLYVTGGSTLEMADNTLLETDQLHIAGDSKVDAALVKTNAATVGYIESNRQDQSEFYAATTSSENLPSLSAAGSSVTKINGNVKKVTATQNARVTIYGAADDVKVKDNAVVITNAAGKNGTEVKPYVPANNTENFVIGTTDAHTIINLCKGYTVNSTLYKQTSELQQLLAKVSSDISNELNAGSALWTSVFDHEQVILSAYLSGLPMAKDIYNTDYYNATSIQNLKNTKDLNTYLVSMFKSNLAQAMVDLTSENLSAADKAKEEAALVREIFSIAKNAEEAVVGSLPLEQRKFIKKATENGSEFTSTEMVEFLRKFYYKENDSNVMLMAQRMKKSYDAIEKFGNAANAIKWTSEALDLLQYEIADYTQQLVVLDSMMAEQPLSAEMYVAAAQLRASMEDKMLGTIEKGMDLIKKEAFGKLKDIWGPVAAGQAILDILGFVTGGTKDAEDLQNGAALCIMAPELLATFESSIKKVQNGDVSDDAVRLVYMNYTMTKRALANMCDIMTNIGNSKQEKAYKEILKKLENMDFGKFVELA